MATVAGSLARTAFRRPLTSSCVQNVARAGNRSALPRGHRPAFQHRHQHQHQSRHGYSTVPPAGEKSSWSSRLPYWALGLTVAGGAAYYFTTLTQAQTVPEALKKGSAPDAKKGGVFKPTREDYQRVYDEVARRLEENDEYDDGSFGPVIVRLAWHCSGTYDKETGTGGSDGATMRFAPENDHGANAGLKAARDFLDPVKEKFPWISYSDLWTLAGVAAIQEMQGPAIPWRPGRNDRDAAACTPDGRLPDATKEQSHLRAIFGRMGFDDREIVALSGAHALGRCHTDRSGFTGPWTFSPTVVTNDYYKLLLDEKWNWKKWNGPRQFEDSKTKTLMMLPTDISLIKDAAFRKHVERYAKDQDAFFKEFSDVIVKLFELGVPFKTKEDERMTFKTSTA
ncbi:MAG: heme peroxidase [Lichina confinis]|nr:MAG: heme peroxidase [Lichina confinis]